jgi:hypothetical protein
MSGFTSLLLKVTGLVLILGSMVDLVFSPWSLPVSFDPSSSEWQIAFTIQMVGQGISPLVGIAFVGMGYLADHLTGDRYTAPSFGDLRVWTYILALLFGLFFIVLIPIHFGNINELKTTELAKIEQQSTQLQEQLGQQESVIKRIEETKDSDKLIQKDIETIDKALKSADLPPAQAQQLQQQRQMAENLLTIAKDPQKLDEAKQKLNEDRNQLLNEKQKQEEQAGKDTGIQIWKVVLRSMVLALGYLIIAGFGFITFSKGKV